jgi:hypothetical protein
MLSYIVSSGANGHTDYQGICAGIMISTTSERMENIMAKRASGAVAKRQTPEKSKQVQKLTLLDLGQTYFQSGEKVVSVEEATDAEFDVFIRQYVELGWSLEERRDALNLAMEKGQNIAFCEPENQEETEEN